MKRNLLGGPEHNCHTTAFKFPWGHAILQHVDVTCGNGVHLHPQDNSGGSTGQACQAVGQSWCGHGKRTRRLHGTQELHQGLVDFVTFFDLI